MRTRTTPVIFILSILSILFSCNRGSTNDEGNEGFTTLNGYAGVPVVVLSGKDNSPCVEKIQEASMIVFKGNNAIKGVEPGSIICSGPVDNAPYGFFYKVKSIYSDDAYTYVETDIASLAEAIQEGAVNKTYAISDYIDYIEGPSGLNMVSYVSDTKTDYSQGITLPISISEKIDGVNYALGGSISINDNLHVDMEFSDWDLLKFEMWMEPSLSFHSVFKADIKITGELFNHIICTIHLKPITFFIGYIPIVITQKIEVRLKGSVNGDIKVECHLLDSDYKSKVGVAYYQNTGWITIAEDHSKGVSFLDSIKLFDINGNITLDLPEISYIPSFYGLTSDNNKVGITASFPLAVSVSEVDLGDIVSGYVNPRLTISCGAKVGVDAKLKIFSKSFLNFSPRANLLTITSLDKHLYPHFSEVVVSDNNDGYARLHCTIEDLDDCFFSNLNDYGFFWKKGEWPNNIKDGTEKKESLGPIDLSQIKIGESNRNYSFEVTLSNLTSSTLYSVRPYSVDSFMSQEHRADETQFKTEGDLVELTVDPESLTFFSRGAAADHECKTAIISGGEGVHKFRVSGKPEWCRAVIHNNEISVYVDASKTQREGIITIEGLSSSGTVIGKCMINVQQLDYNRGNCLFDVRSWFGWKGSSDEYDYNPLGNTHESREYSDRSLNAQFRLLRDLDGNDYIYIFGNWGDLNRIRGYYKLGEPWPLIDESEDENFVPGQYEWLYYEDSRSEDEIIIKGKCHYQEGIINDDRFHYTIEVSLSITDLRLPDPKLSVHYKYDDEHIDIRDEDWKVITISSGYGATDKTISGDWENMVFTSKED